MALQMSSHSGIVRTYTVGIVFSFRFLSSSLSSHIRRLSTKFELTQ